MIQAFLLLLLLQWLGDVLASLLGLPLPGMILGLAVLLAWLAWRSGRYEAAVPAALDEVARGLHAHLGMLFVPAGVGILAHADLLAAEGAAILAAILASTVLGIMVAASIAAYRRASASQETQQ